MKYFIDTEFIEGKKSPKGLLGRICRWIDKHIYPFLTHTIQLISIGIKCEDGRIYYAISSEFNPADADDWVKKNVLHPIELNYIYSKNGDRRNQVLDEFKGKDRVYRTNKIQRRVGKINSHIADDIKSFIYEKEQVDYHIGIFGEKRPIHFHSKIEFYGYYADYDWVVFCRLFGRMIDLPMGFPMYCMDLKQMLDEKCILLKETPDTIKELNGYPKQEDEHNSLQDACWNERLYFFLKGL